MLVQNIGAIQAMMMPNTTPTSKIQSVDLSQLDQIEPPDNVFSAMSTSFLDMVNDIHQTQSALLDIVKRPDNQITSEDLIKTQMLMEDYQNSIAMTSSIIKQVNKAIDSLTHIQ